MNIQILEKDTGYMLYEGKNTNKFYRWGEGLLELVNNKFDKIKRVLNTEISNNISYKNYYENLLNLENSIHYKALLLNVKEFIDKQKNEDEIINDTDKFLSELTFIFFPLFKYQAHLEKLFSKLTCDIIGKNNKQSLKKLFNDDNKNINKKIYRRNTIFDVNESNSSIFINNKGSLRLVHNFSNIIEFCIYELYMFLNTDFKIIRCKECKRFAFVKRRDTECCSKKCSDEYLKNNPFYIKYKTKYTNIANKYSPIKENTSAYEILKPLKKLYDEYKDYYKTPSQNKYLDEFMEKLKEIKY